MINSEQAPIFRVCRGAGGRSNQNTSYNNNVACFTRWDLGDYFNTCTFELEMFKEQLQHENWNTVQMNLPKLDSRISATFGNFRGSKEIFQRGSRYTKYSFLQFCLGLLRLNWGLVVAGWRHLNVLCSDHWLVTLGQTWNWLRFPTSPQLSNLASSCRWQKCTRTEVLTSLESASVLSNQNHLASCSS